MNDSMCKHISNVPRYATIMKASEILGIGRTKLYAFAGDGSLRVVKCGGRALVDMEHALAWMADLPQANIQPQIRRPVAA